VVKKEMEMVKKVFFILIVLYAFIFIGFYFFHDYFIFKPKKLPQDFNYSFDTNFEEVNLKTSDNAILNTLHFKVKKPKGVVLYFHGNKDNLNRWGDIASEFTKYDYDVFVIDYRGYGKSSGDRTEILMYNDAQMCYNYLKKQYDESTMVVYGRSLGGTFACFVASQNNPRQLILEATFSSLQDFLKSRFPLLPYSKLLKFKFNSNEFIGSIKCPTLIFHGMNDRLIPIEQAEKLFTQFNKETTSFIKIKKGTHHNLNNFLKYNEQLDNVLGFK